MNLLDAFADPLGKEAGILCVGYDRFVDGLSVKRKCAIERLGDEFKTRIPSFPTEEEIDVLILAVSAGLDTIGIRHRDNRETRLLALCILLVNYPLPFVRSPKVARA